MTGIALSSRVLPNDITAGFSKLSQITLPLTFSSEMASIYNTLCVCVSEKVTGKRKDKVSEVDNHKKCNKEQIRFQRQKQSSLVKPLFSTTEN